jgi:hypothetical protein
MRARSLERQSKPLSAATVSASTKPAFQANSFDPFDVVIGHLLDEGYADTEEAAIAIMSNMSEEWRESIIEGAPPVPPGFSRAIIKRDPNRPTSSTKGLKGHIRKAF